MNDKDKGIVVAADKNIDALTKQYVIPAKERERAANEARRAAREAVLPDVAAIFAAVPDLRRIEVDGITPYFNDGDPCEHRQHDAKLNGRYSWGDEDDDADEMPELSKADFRKVEAILSGMEDALHVAFDTHWTLTFRRTDAGIEWTCDENTDHD